MDRGAWQATVHRVTKIKHDLAATTHLRSSERRAGHFYLLPRHESKPSPGIKNAEICS